MDLPTHRHGLGQMLTLRLEATFPETALFALRTSTCPERRQVRCCRTHFNFAKLLFWRCQPKRMMPDRKLQLLHNYTAFCPHIFVLLPLFESVFWCIFALSSCCVVFDRFFRNLGFLENSGLSEAPLHRNATQTPHHGPEAAPAHSTPHHSTHQFLMRCKKRRGGHRADRVAQIVDVQGPNRDKCTSTQSVVGRCHRWQAPNSPISSLQERTLCTSTSSTLLRHKFSLENLITGPPQARLRHCPLERGRYDTNLSARSMFVFRFRKDSLCEQ